MSSRFPASARFNASLTMLSLGSEGVVDRPRRAALPRPDVLMSHEALPLETLESLSRQEGMDVRPILVRVLTDLFLQKPNHSPDEIARYEELTLQLLDVVDVATRGVIARKLADEPRAPDAVVARLLEDEPTVAAPLIARVPGLSRVKLLALALDGDQTQAGAVAQRADLDPDMSRLLAHHPNDYVLETLAANRDAALGDAALRALVARALRSPPLAAMLLRREDVDMALLAPLYLHASREQRAGIRKALAERPTRGPGRTLRNVDAVDAALIEAATESGRAHVVSEALSETLGLRLADAAWLSTEPSGEAFVIMLRAAGVENAGVGRALLLCQPEIAQSVARFFELVELAETTPRTVAAELLAALVGEAPAAAPRHEPAFDPSGAVERAGVARPAQRIRRAYQRPGEASLSRG